MCGRLRKNIRLSDIQFKLFKLSNSTDEEAKEYLLFNLKVSSSSDRLDVIRLLLQRIVRLKISRDTFSEVFLLLKTVQDLWF